MPRKPANIAQTEIPVANAVGRKHDPDEAYEAAYGPEKAAEQRAAYTEARRCTCKSEHKDKWGTRWRHEAPCVRAGKRFLVDDAYDARSEARYDADDPAP